MGRPPYLIELWVFLSNVLKSHVQLRRDSYPFCQFRGASLELLSLTLKIEVARSTTTSVSAFKSTRF